MKLILNNNNKIIEVFGKTFVFLLAIGWIHIYKDEDHFTVVYNYVLQLR